MTHCESSEEFGFVDVSPEKESFFTVKKIDADNFILSQQTISSQFLQNGQSRTLNLIYGDESKVLPSLRSITSDGIASVLRIGEPYFGSGLVNESADRTNYFFPLMRDHTLTGILYVSKSFNIRAVKAIPSDYILSQSEPSDLTLSFAHFQTVITGRTTIEPKLLLPKLELETYRSNRSKSSLYQKCDLDFQYWKSGLCHHYVYMDSNCEETLVVKCDDGAPKQGEEHNDCDCDVEPFEDGGDLGGNTNPRSVPNPADPNEL